MVMEFFTSIIFISYIYTQSHIKLHIYIYAHTSIPTSLCPTNPSACQVPVLATLFEG